MALHFYMNGTTGAQDGVEISNGDLSNPLIIDGFNAASGQVLSKTKTLHIRADAGETWYFVFIDIVYSSSDGKDYIILSGNFNNNAHNMTSPSVFYQKTDDYAGTTNNYAPWFLKVSDINIPFSIDFYVVGGEISPDTTAKLIVVGGMKK